MLGAQKAAELAQVSVVCKGVLGKGRTQAGLSGRFQEAGTDLTEKGTALAEALNTKRSPRVSRTDGNKNK